MVSIPLGHERRLVAEQSLNLVEVHAGLD